MSKPTFQHPSMSISEEEESKLYKSVNEDALNGTGNANNDATGSDKSPRTLRRRRPSLSAEVRWDLEKHFSDKTDTEGDAETRRPTSVTTSRKSVNLRQGRRKASLFEVVQNEGWFRRISLPSWAMSADWEAVVRRQESTDRRRPSLQVPSAVSGHSPMQLTNFHIRVGKCYFGQN